MSGRRGRRRWLFLDEDRRWPSSIGMVNDLHGYIISNLVTHATTHRSFRRTILGLLPNTTLVAPISTGCLGRQALLDSSNMPTTMLLLDSLLLIVM